MKLIWTKSSAPLSALIRWGLSTDCSHFLIVFNSPAGGLCFHSNLLGTHPKFWKNTKKQLSVVHEIDLDLPIEVEDRVWDIVVDRYDGKGYDFKAFAYLGWRIILKKLFNKPMPVKNKWAEDQKFLCDEIYAALVECQVVPDLGIDIAMSSPHEIFELLSEHLRQQKAVDKQEI